MKIVKGLVYSDPEGIWEVVETYGAWVEVRNVETDYRALVQVDEVRYFVENPASKI